MIKEIQNIFKLFFMLISGAAITIACESEADELGLQFFQAGNAQGTETTYEIIAFNADHNNVIEADNDKLTEATLGAFDEPNFGMQKSSYVTQVRLSSYDPDFGTNPKVDSVVLQIKPLYYTASDSVKTATYEDYIHPDNVAAKKVVTTYPIKKYGKAKRNFTINVNEVDDFLDSPQTNFKSDKQVTIGKLLGSRTFDGYLRAIKITKDSDNSELFSRDAGLRINLDKDYIETKIINKKGSFELKDAASFIRYFKGIRISVAENDGYIFNFNPNEITAVIYYKHDNSSTDNSKVNATYSLDLGVSNAHFNQIQYSRPNAFDNAMTSSNQNTGDPIIYMQGMGGPGVEIKIPKTEIDKLKTLYNTQKIGILSAKIRLYSSESWNNKYYAKPSAFVVLDKEKTSTTTTTYSFLKDLTTFLNSGVYKMVNAVDLDKNPAYYEISITQTLKDIIEKEATSEKSITLDVGDFQRGNTGYLGKDFTTMAYTPNRILLVGSNVPQTDGQYANRAQLKVIYSKK